MRFFESWPPPEERPEPADDQVPAWLIVGIALAVVVGLLTFAVVIIDGRAAS